MIRFAEQGGFSTNEAVAFDLVSEVGKVFGQGGWLEKALGFEHRPQQEQMARRFSQSLLDSSHLLFEAGTGVGKSLAYLVPAVLQSRAARRPCVVATNTISLQEQLLELICLFEQFCFFATIGI